MCVLSTCSLNQLSLDFTGNLKRTLQSFETAKSHGSIYRLGPELEVSGYGCNDHFLEADTVLHCWQVLAEIIATVSDIIGDVGMPVWFNGVLFNCRILFYNQSILLIRPKRNLANDGCYRENRWFTPWLHGALVDFPLPSIITNVTGQSSVPFGNAILSTPFAKFGTESCEELFVPLSPHIELSLAGVHVFTNGSASHHQFKKLGQRISLICDATRKCGGVYLYSNMQGCDGERVYYDGCPLIALNGNVLAQGSQFSLQDVQVISANIDIQDVESYRSGFISRNFQAASAPIYPQILLETSHVPKSPNSLSYPIDPVIYSPSEEIEYGPACWLWDYLRRSKSGGFFLPLSGGLDSCSTALIVFSMATMVYEEFQKPKNLQDQTVIEDLRTIVNDPQFTPKSPAEICNLIFHTCYMKTSNSSTETEQRAFSLSKSIGSYHLSFNIDNIISAIVQVFQLATGLVPKFKVFGGSVTENLALQNIQARSRMVVSYFFAQLLLWTRGNPRSLLVLSSANVDETLRGYFTKYDCSSGDINPIGGISKTDLKQFVKHMSTKIDGLSAFLDATPTAELEPLTSTYSQSDEVDMEMTYEELSIFGTLRKVHKMGPYSMFKRLLIEWRHLEPKMVAQKVKKFFFYYSINRHKTTILPPSYHMSLYSPDDNRFDLRQFLYNAAWTWQFQKIDDHVSKL